MELSFLGAKVRGNESSIIRLKPSTNAVKLDCVCKVSLTCDNEFVLFAAEMSEDDVQTQMSIVMHWFANWNCHQREEFMTDLVYKAVPNKLLTIVDSMSNLGVADCEQSVFSCQLRMFGQWFSAWTDDERNCFLERLSEVDTTFVDLLNFKVAATAGHI